MLETLIIIYISVAILAAIVIVFVEGRIHGQGRAPSFDEEETIKAIQIIAVGWPIGLLIAIPALPLWIAYKIIFKLGQLSNRIFRSKI